MGAAALDWTKDLERWLRPFLGRLGHKNAAADVPGLRLEADRSW
jgi:hypothetical protein